MPELPEVDTVRAGLVQLLAPPRRLREVVVHRGDLRFPVPSDLHERLAGRQLRRIDRRAKYLLWHFDDLGLISHLGMTGSWRVADDERRTHDHLLLRFAGLDLVYHDPRRFGYCTCCPVDDLADHPFLADLGPEPLGPDFTVDHLAAACHGSRAPIKNRIMDQRVVVGVGNIYAVESLHRAGIAPLRPAGRISSARLARLVTAIRSVLDAAIAAGGSTIRDFRQAGGSGGYFQHDFRVYGRGGEPCLACGRSLRQTALGGRATVWCPACQK